MDKSLAAGEVRQRTAQFEGEAKRRWVPALARVGLLAKGLSFAIVGGLAVALAAGQGGKATSREGALATIADEPGGEILLVLLALGFAAYALWRFSEPFLENGDDGAKKYGKWAAWVGGGVIYAGLAYGTVKLLVSAGGSQSQNAKAQHATSEILSWPAGTWLVGIAGACVVGAGLYNGYRGVARKFREEWKTGEMKRAALKWGTRVGVVGLLSRMVVFGLIGCVPDQGGGRVRPEGSDRPGRGASGAGSPELRAMAPRCGRGGTHRVRPVLRGRGALPRRQAALTPATARSSGRPQSSLHPRFTRCAPATTLPCGGPDTTTSTG